MKLVDTSGVQIVFTMSITIILYLFIWHVKMYFKMNINCMMMLIDVFLYIGECDECYNEKLIWILWRQERMRYECVIWNMECDIIGQGNRILIYEF